MRANAILKVVNPLLFLAVLVQAVTGLGMWLFTWGAVLHVHIANGIVLLVLAGAHLMLNWRWVRVTYRRRSAGSKSRA
jgi:hypothetical protein